MDWHAAFDVAMAIATILGGWMLRIIFSALKDLKVADTEMVKDVKSADSELHHRIDGVIADLPGTYMRRDDFRSFAEDIKSSLTRIEGKLDRKADK